MLAHSLIYKASLVVFIVQGMRVDMNTRAPAIAEKPRDSFMSVEMLADVW